MTFDEWLDIAQESAESELGENVTMLTPEEAVNIYKLVRAQREYIHRLRTEDEGFHEGHMAQIAAEMERLEAALMAEE